MQKLFLGEDVHYHDHQGGTHAAKVVKVIDDHYADLAVFDAAGGLVNYQSVPWATSYGYPGAWSRFEDSPEFRAAVEALKGAGGVSAPADPGASDFKAGA